MDNREVYSAQDLLRHPGTPSGLRAGKAYLPDLRMKSPIQRQPLKNWMSTPLTELVTRLLFSDPKVRKIPLWPE
jgi:hypothetical protein